MPQDAQRWWQRKRFARARGPKWLAKLLRDIERDHDARCSDPNGPPPSAGWLLHYRPQFRRLPDGFPYAILAYVKQCPESMKPIAIWLLGRCAIRTEHLGLFECALHASPVGRRHAARALRRIEAWEKLRTLARLHPYERQVVWYATAPVTKRDFPERLRNFAAQIDATHADDAAGPSRMPLWFADLDWIRRPSKSVEYIRRMLVRIHRWVHGMN
jgi:hypothetical protein